MAEGAKRNKSKKNRKHGRMKNWCKAYALSHRREKNKVRRLRTHLKTHPNDGSAVRSLENTRKAIKGVASATP